MTSKNSFVVEMGKILIAGVRFYAGWEDLRFVSPQWLLKHGILYVSTNHTLLFNQVIWTYQKLCCTAKWPLSVEAVESFAKPTSCKDRSSWNVHGCGRRCILQYHIKEMTGLLAISINTSDMLEKITG